MKVTSKKSLNFREKLTQYTAAIVAGLAIVTSSHSVLAQEEGSRPAEGDRPAAREGQGNRPRRPGGERPGGERPNSDRPGTFNRRGEGERPGMRPGMPGGPMMLPPVMVALDTDKDGRLSASEIENAAKSLLTLDKDGDGMLSIEELRPPMPEGFPPGGQRFAGGPNGGPGPGMMGEEFMNRMFQQRDANGDGKLEGDEIPPPMKERASMIDTNGDGALDKEELRVASQRMRERMGQGGEGRLQPPNRRDGETVRPRRPEGESKDDE